MTTELEIAFYDWRDDGVVHVWLYTPGDELASAEIDVRVRVFDVSRWGRDIEVELLDICGEPSAQAWLDANRDELIELYDEHLLRRPNFFLGAMEA